MEIYNQFCKACGADNTKDQSYAFCNSCGQKRERKGLNTLLVFYYIFYLGIWLGIKEWNENRRSVRDIKPKEELPKEEKAKTSIKPLITAPPKQPKPVEQSVHNFHEDKFLGNLGKLIQFVAGILAVVLAVAFFIVAFIVYSWIALGILVGCFPLLLLSIGGSRWANNLSDTKIGLLGLVLIISGFVWFFTFVDILRWLGFF